MRIATDAGSASAYIGSGESKPAWRRIADNVAWAARYRAENKNYYMYGMDRRDDEHYSQILAAERAGRDFDRQIEADGSSRAVALIRDKFFFSLVAQSLGYPSPQTLALLTPEGVDVLHPRRSLSYREFVAEDIQLDGFAKEVGGARGKGAFVLRVDDGSAWVDGEPVTPHELAAKVDGQFLVQERIEQHERLAALHGPSVNTVRLITVLRGGRAEPVTAALRVGAGGAPVDNMGAGGLVVGLDLGSGRCYGRALFKPGRGPEGGRIGSVEHHPDTGIAFDGYAVPFAPEFADAACRFHEDLGGPRSIGWDIAFTQSAPLIIEANSHWTPAVHATLDPDFMGTFERTGGTG